MAHFDFLQAREAIFSSNAILCPRSKLSSVSDIKEWLTHFGMRLSGNSCWEGLGFTPFAIPPRDPCRILRRAELASKVLSIAFGEQGGEEQYAEAIRLQDIVKASPDECIRLLTGSPVKSCVSASLPLDNFCELGQEALDNILPLIPGKVQVATQLSDLLGVVNAADGSSFLIGQSGRKQPALLLDVSLFLGLWTLPTLQPTLLNNLLF